MLFLCLFKILGKRERRALGETDEQRILYTVKELAVTQAGVFYEDTDIGIDLFVLFPLAARHRAELVRHLLDNVSGDLSYICVVLEIAARNVQRQLGAVDGAAEHE